MEDVDKALAIYRKECYSSVCVCVMFGIAYSLSREFQQDTPLSLVAPLSLQAQNVLGTALFPWVPLLSPYKITVPN